MLPSPGQGWVAAPADGLSRALAHDPITVRISKELVQRFDPFKGFEFVRARRGRWPVGCMCRVLGVSPSGYYAWLKRGPSRRAQENEALSKRIAEIHEASHGTYGSRRVHAELLEGGDKLSRQRVARLMRNLGLQGGDGGGKRIRPARIRGAHLSHDR